MPTPAEAGARPWLAWATAAVLLVYAGVLLVGGLHNALRFPFSDAHDWAARVLAAERTGGWGAFAWTAAGEQRIPLALTVEAVDIELVGGRAPTFAVATLLSLGLGAGTLAALLAGARDRCVAGVLAVLSGLVLLNVSMAEDVSYPVFSVYLFVCGPALAAAVAAGGGGDERLSFARLATAVALGLLASCGNAAGLAVWPALAAGAGLRRTGWPSALALLAAGAVTAGVFQAGLGMPAPPHPDVAAAAPEHLAKIASYFARFGALPWTQRLPGPAPPLAGFAAEAAAVGSMLAARPWRAQPYAALVRTGTVLVVFGLAVAALAALGRVDESPLPLVPTRYTPFAALLQVGAVLCAAPLVARACAAWSSAKGAALLLLTLGMLGGQLTGVRKFTLATKHLRNVSAAFDRGVARPDPAINLHPDPAFARRIRAELAARARGDVERRGVGSRRSDAP